MITRPVTAQFMAQFMAQVFAQVDGQRDGRGKPSSGSPSQIVRTSLVCRPLEAPPLPGNGYPIMIGPVPGRQKDQARHD